MSVKALATPPLPSQPTAPLPRSPCPSSLIVIGWRITGKSRARVTARFSTAIALFMLMSKRIYQIRIQRQIQIRVPATVLTRFINFQRLMRLTQFSATEMMTTPPPSSRTNLWAAQLGAERTMQITSRHLFFPLPFKVLNIFQMTHTIYQLKSHLNK